MLSRPRKPPLKTLLPSASSRLSHQVKLMSSFWKMRSRNSRSRPPSIRKTRSAAITCTGGLTSSKFHSYAGSAPFGCWNHSRSSTSELVLRERRVEVRPRDAVEAEVPRREPRVLPRVRHREHVERVEVPPAAVAAVLASRGRRRLARVAVEPAAHVVRVHLLAPDEPGAGLAQDPHLLRRRCPSGASARVELVRVGLARGDDLVERGARPVAVAVCSSAGRCSRSRSSALPPAGTVTR